jgi:hypothetical protein
MSDRLQNVTGCPSEFGIQSHHLDGELYFVGDALAGTVPARKEFEVGEIVVRAVSVSVMNCFVFVQRATQMLLHYIPMFHDGVALASNERRYSNPDVTVPFYVSPNFATLKFGQRAFFERVVFAFWTAILLLLVKAASGLASFVSYVSTTLANKSAVCFCVFTAFFVSAFARAVQRVVFVFLAVFGQVRLHHAKGITAIVTGESNYLTPRCGNRFSEAERASAAQTAKAFVIARIAKERLSAFLTSFLDWHGKTSVFGDRSILAMSFGIVK